MAGESTAATTRTSTASLSLRILRTSDGYRRQFVWAEIILAFLFLELALWAPNSEARNCWAAATGTTILVLLLMDRPSPERLGLRLPTAYGAGMVLGIGCATVIFTIALLSLTGRQIPANSLWPKLQLAWGYVIWAFVQEFMLQSFFFNRSEQLYGSRAAVFMAAALFAAAHLPNFLLTTAALIGALLFCELFRRYRSIYPLGTVHAMLGLTLAIVTPDRLLHHMRVGIGYLHSAH